MHQPGMHFSNMGAKIRLFSQTCKKSANYFT